MIMTALLLILMLYSSVQPSYTCVQSSYSCIAIVHMCTTIVIVYNHRAHVYNHRTPVYSHRTHVYSHCIVFNLHNYVLQCCCCYGSDCTLFTLISSCHSSKYIFLYVLVAMATPSHNLHFIMVAMATAMLYSMSWLSWQHLYRSYTF